MIDTIVANVQPLPLRRGQMYHDVRLRRLNQHHVRQCQLWPLTTIQQKTSVQKNNYIVPKLDQIMDLKMSHQGLACTPEARKVAHDIFK